MVINVLCRLASVAESAKVELKVGLVWITVPVISSLAVLPRGLHLIFGPLTKG